MNGDHSLIVSSKQQKSLRLDAFATKLAEDNPAKISANGYVDNSLENGTVKMLEAKIETRMCIECGSGFLGGGAAEVCDTCSGVGGAMQMGVGLVCPLCSGLVLNHNAARVCTSCKKFVHRECDRSDVNMTEFVCASCRRSPLVGDIMLSAAIGPASPLGAESDSITVPSSTSVSDLTLNPFRSSSPVTTGAVVPDFNVDVYNMSEGISSPATTSDSARNSPFYPENSPSDVDEDFVPGSSRGGYTSRGRGGAKKKPGRGSSSKTRGAKPPSGDPSIFPPSTRGKRGKRGLKVNGIGKAPGTGRGRGRGRGANSQLQQSAVLQQIIMQQQQQQQLQLHQQQPQIREVDETMLGEDDDRNARADDVEYVRTAIICDAQDQYMQQSSICLVCGAVGKPHTQESSMVACCNCAQTFHTYCVGLHDKLNQAVVNRGWRCLDCTICEGCGEGKDESKLLLCEECDVSFHIYCLSPPLDRIPNGPWRCQWCARCRRCNVRVTSGTDLSREGLCTTCSSLRKCPKCSKLYNIGEKIIKCSACARWYHGTCEDLYNDEMLESASANKMRCSACRPNSRTTSALMGLSDHSSLLICDNVALNKSAEEVLQSRFMPSLFRPNPVDSFGYRSESFDHYGTEDDFLQEEIEMLSTSTRGRGMGRGGGPGRRVPKLGVGGFFVKIPRHRLLTMEDDLPDEDGNKKQKRPRKPRRSQLEDAYPPAIQEGFFGMRPVEGKALIDAVVEEPSLAEYGKGRTTTAIEAVGRGHELSHEATEQLKNDLTEVDILENLDIGEVDLDNMDMDFTNWMEDDEDDDFDDSLNDAFDIVKADGFEPSTNSDLASTPVSSVPTGPTTFPNDVTNITPAPATPAYLMANKAKSLSRSSSQMDGVEKNNPTTERWEEDEPLGSQATKAAVLYANERHAYLKEKYPDWNDRVKHIQRLWRVLDTENRQDFVSRARENRANRGKQPRVKRVVYKHAAAAADERFKVPNVPGGSQMRSDFYHSEMGGQVPQEVPVQQIRSTAHLTQPVLEQYELMRTRTLDLQKHQQVIESDLNRMRKQKKNLAAKRRQMMKSAGTDADGKQIPVDLNEQDRMALQILLEQIPSRQKDLESCKRDLKTHLATVYEFEHKWNIVRNVEPGDAMRMAMAQRAAAGGAPQPVAAGGAPLPGTPLSSPTQMPGASAQFHPPIAGSSPQFQQMRVPQQVPYGAVCGPPPQEMMQRPPMQVPRPHMWARVPAPVLGGILYERLQTPFEKEVYECLDDVVSRVSMHFDGRDPAREGSGMLKRLLEPAMGQQMPPMGPGPQGPPSHLMDQLEPPRPKKKRAQQKKFESVGMGNEYDLMVERVNTQLRLCEQLPKRAMEPAPRNPGAAFATMGISDLPDRRDKRALIGKEFGHLSLSFVDDYYTGKGRDTECLEMTSLSMSDLAPQANLPALTNIPPPPLYEMVVDAEDAAFGSFDQWAVFANSLDRQPCANHMRVASKIPEFTIPLEPRRKVFSMKPDTVEEVEVSLVVKEETSVPPGTGVAALFEQLRSILGVEQLIEYQLDTPPLSPEPSTKSESVDNIKREPPDVTQTPVSGGGRCRACDRSMEAVLIQQTMSQLGLTPSDDEKDDTVCFCSMKCYYQFVAASKVALSPDQLTAAESHVDEETLAKLRQISAESFAKCINQGKMRMDLPAAPAVPPDAFLTSPRDTRYVMDEGRRDNVQIIRVADLATIQDAAQRKDTTRSPGDDWKAYSRELLHSFFKIQQTKQELALSPKMGVGLGTSFELDRRVCVLCGGIGDGDPALCGRLLNLSANLWVHVNCAMWSTEVFETTSGALLHVDRAVVRAAGVICHLCGRVGASVQCHKVDCNVNFHLPCAAKIQTAKFVKDKTFFCTKHPEISPEVMVTSLEALRRIYIERDENAFLSRLFDYSDSCSRLCLRIGALCFFQVGQLLPDQLKTFHNATHIFPNGYHVSRWFWSPTDPRKREIYDCHIKDVDHRPKFVVSYADHTYEGDSATEAWSQVVNSVERIRSQSDALRFLAKGITGETLFGLNESVISKITESLPGVDGLFTYTFRHPNSPLLDLPLAVNPSGCARCEPRFRTLIKHKQRALASAPSTSRSTQDGGSSSSGRTRGRIAASFTDELAAAQMRAMLQASGIGSEWALALGGREPFSSNSQSYTLYQKMRKDWRQTVYLARSKIQGLGLYAKRDIHMGDMIIEYKGEVIRSEVGEMREKRYVAQNRGVYMFRIDEDLLVDATMAGGPARYINHSCDPNCSTRILAAGPYPEDKKIIITANRPIKALEELTYDYQFELEDTTDKIPCLCGAPNCVKWMN
uniref:Histone-lysine N-methyltransferase n=2 Tax=Haemonchus contortus TaxID=6289 RepID=A0A7I4YD27_HAECO